MKLFAILAVIIGICFVFVGADELVCCPCEPEPIPDGGPGIACKECACADDIKWFIPIHTSKQTYLHPK